MYKVCDSNLADDSDGHENNQSKQEMATNPTEKSHYRKRKKQFFNKIRKQMEFYFGDANLSKDRFLNKLLGENDYIPLSTFLNFNKIKTLTLSIEDIQKAVESSEMLELSCDRLTVRRTTDIQKKADVDECVIYIEALPPKATHETIRKQFKQFGNVVYVSLPKYRSGRIKEFAFVEFEDKESVDRCINTFRQFNGVIGDSFDAEKLKSIEAYIKEQEEAEIKEKEAKENVEASETNIEKPEKSADAEEKDKITKNSSKNERESATDMSDTESIASQPPEKRVKYDSEGPPDDKATTDGEDDNKADEKTENADENRDIAGGKKRRRRKNKSNAAMPDGSKNGSNNVANAQQQTENNPSSSIEVLRIATKVEWKRLRNKYLTVQREKFTEAKKLLQQQRKSASIKKKSTLPQLVRPVTMKMKHSSPPPQVAKRICTRNINFYGAMREEQSSSSYECSIVDENKSKAKNEEDKPNEKKAQFAYEPGLIVRVNFETPCVDVADFKAEMKQHAFVKYVDLKEGQSFAVVRVDASRSAPVLIKHCAPNRCQILTGDKEKDYWAKIAEDRDQKLSKAVKVPRNRNRKTSKVLKSIAEINVVKTEHKTISTHIRFDE